MPKSLSIKFNAKIKPVKAINEEFTLCKCYVLALGKNRNNSIIEKSAVEKALPSLFNTPVVGHVYVDIEGNKRLGAHDMTLEKDENGKYKFQVLTVPYGTVPEDNEVSYEEVVESNGEIKTYLTCNIILWTSRYPELKECIYSENIWFGQSMEIKAKEISRGSSQEDKNFIYVNKFTFSALCLLGKSDDGNFHHEPCFSEAKIEPLVFNLDEKFTQEFNALKEQLSRCFSAKPKENVDNATHNAFNCTVSTKSYKTHLSFAATYAARREAISNALQGLAVSNDALRVQYYLVDFDEQYAYVERFLSNQNMPQGSYSKGRIRYSLSDNEVAILDENSFQTMLIKWLTVAESAALDSQREELAALLAYKSNHETLEKKRQLDAIANTFSDLAGDDAFKAILSKYDSFSVAQFSVEKLETECYALRGKKVATSIAPKIPVSEHKSKSSKYGGFFDKHLNKEE